jgi:hypothetical protein
LVFESFESEQHQIPKANEVKNHQRLLKRINTGLKQSTGQQTDNVSAREKLVERKETPNQSIELTRYIA